MYFTSKLYICIFVPFHFWPLICVKFYILQIIFKFLYISLFFLSGHCSYLVLHCKNWCVCVILYISYDICYISLYFLSGHCRPTPLITFAADQWARNQHPAIVINNNYLRDARKCKTVVRLWDLGFGIDYDSWSLSKDCSLAQLL